MTLIYIPDKKCRAQKLKYFNSDVAEESLHVPHEGFRIADPSGVLNLNQIENATVTNPAFVQSIAPILTESIKSVLTPTLNESVENAVKKTVEPLLIQMRSQSESIASLKDELQQVKNENKKIIAQLYEFESNIDDLEQHGRRNSLRVFSVPMSDEQAATTDQVIVKLCKEQLGVDI